MRENPHETARGHRGRRRSEAGEIAPLLPRGSRVDCGVSDSGRGAEAATKCAPVFLGVSRGVLCTDRHSLWDFLANLRTTDRHLTPSSSLRLCEVSVGSISVLEWGLRRSGEVLEE